MTFTSGSRIFAFGMVDVDSQYLVSMRCLIMGEVSERQGRVQVELLPSLWFGQSALSMSSS
jgi:hypothetical protein